MLGFGLDLWKMALMGGASGALALLNGESAGLAIDFTTSTGPNAGVGEVAVIGHTTNLRNVSADSFLQSGTSPKLVLGSDGLYRWTPHNLLLQSDTFDNASWAATNASVVANADGVADTITNSSDFGQINQSYSTVAGATYTFSILFKKTSGATYFPGVSVQDVSANYHSMALNTDTGVGAARTGEVPQSFSTADAGGYWRVNVTVTCVGNLKVYLYPRVNADASATWAGGNGSATVKNAQLNRGTTPTTYHVTTAAAWFGVPIEYSSGYYGLVEPAATNVLTYSQDFTNAAWAVFGGSAKVGASPVAAPDGSMTAYEVSFGATGGAIAAASVFYQRFTGTVAAYTGSIFVRAKSGSTTIRVSLSDGTTVTGTADLTVTDQAWTRLPYTATSAVSAVCYLGLSNNVAGTTSNVYVWQGQVELGTVATSPIPTFAATVTRAADNINVATSAFPLSVTAGTILTSFTIKDYPSGSPHLWNLSDNTTDERILVFNSGTNVLSGFVADGGVTQVNTGIGAAAVNAAAKFGVVWAANDWAGVADGAAAVTDGSVTLPTMTTLRIGANESGAQVINGKFRSLVYLPRRMTNAELQAKTAP